jgi:hypothetical protein
MKWVVTVLLPLVVVPLLLNVFTDWSPRLAQWIVAHASHRMPTGYQKRCAEEWRAYLTDIPGGLSQLAVALGYWIRIPLLRKAVGAPAFRFRALHAISKAAYVLRRSNESLNNVVSGVIKIFKPIVDILANISERAAAGGLIAGFYGGFYGGIFGGVGGFVAGFGGGFGDGVALGTMIGAVGSGVIGGVIGAGGAIVRQYRSRGSTLPIRSRSSTGS